MCRIPTQTYDQGMEADQLDTLDRRLVHALLIAPRAPFGAAKAAFEFVFAALGLSCAASLPSW